MMEQADVVIIGSGISALTSAALLAKKGKSVIVLEQYSKPGGYMHSFKRFGLTYDSGAHYFGSLDKGQPFRILLEYLNVLNDEGFKQTFLELDPKAFDVFKFPDGDVSFPRGYDNVISELSSLFPNERHAIKTYFDEIKRVVQFFPTYVFDDETDPESAMIPLETSLKSFVEKLTQNSKLQ
ncbi:MAG: NAD(P)/FAD-dependent oxidoreductase, partial [Proteobacteria bacterium]